MSKKQYAEGFITPRFISSFKAITELERKILSYIYSFDVQGKHFNQKNKTLSDYHYESERQIERVIQSLVNNGYLERKFINRKRLLIPTTLVRQHYAQISYPQDAYSSPSAMTVSARQDGRSQPVSCDGLSPSAVTGQNENQSLGTHPPERPVEVIHKTDNKSYNKVDIKTDNTPTSSGSVFYRIELALNNKNLEYSKDIVKQIEYYVGKSNKDEAFSINIAVKKYSENQWNIPNGYNGITSKSIKAKEDALQREQQKRIIMDVNAKKEIERGFEEKGFAGFSEAFNKMKVGAT